MADGRRVLPREVIATARTLIDTPYQHQGRLPGVALDCAGVPIVVCKLLGLGDFDYTNYNREPDGVKLVEYIESVCQPIELQLGAMLVFRIRKYPQHVGIVTPYALGGYGLIHAYQGAGKVAEHQLDEKWCDRIVGIYGLPGVTYAN